MAVEGSIPKVSFTLSRDSHGNWHGDVTPAEGMRKESLGRTATQALGAIVARTVDHPFDVRGLAQSIEQILGVKEAS